MNNKKSHWFKVSLICVSVVVLLCSCAYAAEPVDFSGYTIDELVAIRQELDRALTSAIMQAGEPGSDVEYHGMRYVSNGKEVRINTYVGSDPDVVIPQQIDGVPVTMIGDEAFKKTSINTLTIPEGIVSIGRSAFALTKTPITNVIVLPTTLTSIDGEAFVGCYAPGVILQTKGTVKLDYGPFNYAGSFLYVREGCNIEFSKSKKQFAHGPELIILPSTVTHIPDGIFDGNAKLVIVAPAGSYVESYCKNNFIICNTADYDKYVAQYDQLIGQ